ncbi:MAG: molybdenum cofactor guanylyltransferase, partial [Ilumatobacteraceae bacterium]
PDSTRPTGAAPGLNPCGAVLVGGRSTRFGSDKSRAEAGGVSLLARIVTTLRSADVGSLAYVGGLPRSDIPPDIVHVADEVVGHPGDDRSSLLGVLAGMTHARANGHDSIVILGCDVPMVETSTIRALISTLESVDASVAHHDGDHWSIMALRTIAYEAIESHYARGERAIHRAVSQLSVARVPVSASECVNVNDVATLHAVSVLLGTAD